MPRWRARMKALTAGPASAVREWRTGSSDDVDIRKRIADASSV